MQVHVTALKKLNAWYNSPLLFVKECIGAKPSDQQADLLSKLTSSKRSTVRSGHGTGKGTVASWIILWFTTTRPYAKVVCTAPTARQLADILWSELSKWLRQSSVAEEFVLQKDKMFHKDAPREWWVRAVSPSVKASKEEQAETLAGFHGDHILIIVDEASGVPDPVFIPIEGIMTQEDNRILLIGNPTRSRGYFYDTHFHAEIKKSWLKFHWDSRKSSNVSPDFPTYMAQKYGEASNVFRIRVEGEPPHEDATTLIPLAWAEQCVGNTIEVPEDEPLFLGVDVARYGDDESVILPRTGLLIHPWTTFQGMSTMDLGGHILLEYTERDADGVGVDEIGVGGGVVDWLEKRRLPGLFGVNVALASSDITKADRLRDELWLAIREKCMRGLYSFPDIKKPGDTLSIGQELANELSSPTYSFNKHGGIIVESKKLMKSRGLVSPNKADALGITEYFYHISTQIFKRRTVNKAANRKPGRFIPPDPQPRSQSWMAV